MKFKWIVETILVVIFFLYIRSKKLFLNLISSIMAELLSSCYRNLYFWMQRQKYLQHLKSEKVALDIKSDITQEN